MRMAATLAAESAIEQGYDQSTRPLSARPAT